MLKIINQVQMKNLPASRINQDEYDMLIPVGSFVTVLEEKEQSENLEMGYKAI